MSTCPPSRPEGTPPTHTHTRCPRPPLFRAYAGSRRGARARHRPQRVHLCPQRAQGPQADVAHEPSGLGEGSAAGGAAAAAAAALVAGQGRQRRWVWGRGVWGLAC
eukprot:319535-Chlamydomonas_euryale.AAC.1